MKNYSARKFFFQRDIIYMSEIDLGVVDLDYMQKYNQWVQNKYFDADTIAQLKNIAGDDKEIKERFYKDLEFGTGGLRGIIGAGTNRINKYTIRKATQGLADFINNTVESSKRCVAIAYDSRLFSKEFARETALVLNANDIKTYLFCELTPTPVLSFAVRYLKCCCGIVITASHNPKEYNGYKVYWKDGAQVTSPIDSQIVECVNKINSFAQIKLIDEEISIEKGLFNIIGDGVYNAYIEAIKKQRVHLDTPHDLKIVYTPLNGSGNKLVRRILKETGFENVAVVAEQELPDSNFTTIGVPNPEYPQAFKLALDLANEKNADIILGTDPDSDRIGVVVNDNGDYKYLTGNMTGILLCEYILSQKKSLGILPANPVIISTLVSTKLAKKIADEFGAEYIEVLTGFKYICREIRNFEGKKNFVFGFEESYGYLAGTHSRDKDAIVAAMLICEMADFYKSQGLTLIDALDNIYKKYGCQKEILNSLELKGIDGLAQMQNIMANLRNNPPSDICDIKIKSISDFKSSTKINSAGEKSFLVLPKSDVIFFELEDDSWICIRPSGTEPKIKIYVGACATNISQADDKLKMLLDGFKKFACGDLL